MKGANKNNAKGAVALATLIAISGITYIPAAASELVYHPYNPSFGGSPLNGSVLLNSALATRKHKAPDVDSDRFGIEEKSPLDQLNETLERLLVSRMASAASMSIMDENGNFKPGLLETQNFIITVTEMADGGMSITTFDKTTGATTTVEVNQL